MKKTKFIPVNHGTYIKWEKVDAELFKDEYREYTPEQKKAIEKKNKRYKYG